MPSATASRSDDDSHQRDRRDRGTRGATSDLKRGRELYGRPETRGGARERLGCGSCALPGVAGARICAPPQKSVAHEKLKPVTILEKPDAMHGEPRTPSSRRQKLGAVCERGVRHIYSRLLREPHSFLLGNRSWTISRTSSRPAFYLEQEDPARDIYMYITRPGGRFTSGLAIYDHDAVHPPRGCRRFLRRPRRRAWRPGTRCGREVEGFAMPTPAIDPPGRSAACRVRPPTSTSKAREIIGSVRR